MSDSVNEGSLTGRRVGIVYDCLYPFTRGGAERWYRVLADRFVKGGATVTYLTRRQWTADAPTWTGVDVVAVSGTSELYDAEGTRRTGPALSFGVGTFLWAIRHRRRFDAVVVGSFPFFSLLAVRSALVGSGTPVLVDYHEVWSTKYWRTYSGWWKGSLGAAVEQLCIRVTPMAQVFTSESARRLRSRGFRGDVAVLAGLLPSVHGENVVTAMAPQEPMVLFVGRQVKHKGVRLLPAVFAAARESLPTLTMTVVGDGPERTAVEAEVKRLGLDDAITFTGAVSDEELRTFFERATCTIVPSFREGYGIVVGESISYGTPVVVADNPENLATTLVVSGVNGFVVEPTARGMAKGVIEVVAAGDSLRLSTAEWSARFSATMSIDQSADEMVDRLSAQVER